MLTIAALVLVRSRQPALRLFGIFSIGLGCWLIFQFLTDAKVTGGLLWLQLASASSGFLALLFPIFAYMYPNFRKPPGKWLAVALMPIFLLVPLSFTRLFVSNVYYDAGGVEFTGGPLYSLQTALLISYFLSGVYILINRIRRSTTAQRTQLYLLLLAFAAGLVGVTLAGVVFPENEYWQTARPLGILSLDAIMGYAMVYRGLFDIRFFVVRATAYLTTVFILSLVIITPLVLLFEYVFGINFHGWQVLLTVTVLVILMYALQYLRIRFDRFTNRIFFRHYYEPQDVLDRLSEVLVRTADIDILKKDTARILSDTLRPIFFKYTLLHDSDERAARFARHLYSASIESGLRIIDVETITQEYRNLNSLLKQGDINIAVRLRTTHEDLGFIVLGYKQSGEAYNERDKRLLNLAADEIAISMQNALRFRQIQQFNLTLQEKVDEATRKLRQTNQKLLELDEAKDDFISMASHQLRTPLTSVKGYISMVLDGDAGKINRQQAKMLRTAFSSSQRMVYLITDLLNISRLKTGKFVIDASPTDLSELASQEVIGLQEAAKLKDIKLTYQKPRDFPKLMLDEVKTRQVVMNFIDNALYYTPSGGHVRIELKDLPAAVELRVIDDGIGVPRSEQHHLFTKFYRAGNARKIRPDGTGLGLFMAKKVISAQGGSIIFTSREGQGSTFGFIFSKTKLKVSDQPAQAEAASVAR